MRRVGGYTLSTRLASGALGAVFLARSAQERDAPERALKFIRSELMADLRFARLLMAEGPSAERFRHPAAVEVIKVERVNDDAFLVMELLAGQPFSVVTQRARIDNEPLSHRLLAWVGAQVASALLRAHETPWFAGAPAPMVHGALAPRSLFVTYDGQVRLLGLGLGRARQVIAPSHSRLPYLAPEILQGRDLTARADVYGLALTLYEAFTGRTLFRRATAEASRAAVLQANVPRLNARNLEINPDIGDLLADMMAPRPAARPETLDHAQAALESAADGDGAGFERALATFMSTRFREEQEAFQRQLAVAHRPAASGVVSGVGPVAVDSGPPRANGPRVSVQLPVAEPAPAQVPSADVSLPSVDVPANGISPSSVGSPSDGSPSIGPPSVNGAPPPPDGSASGPFTPVNGRPSASDDPAPVSLAAAENPPDSPEDEADPPSLAASALDSIADAPIDLVLGPASPMVAQGLSSPNDALATEVDEEDDVRADAVVAAPTMPIALPPSPDLDVAPGADGAPESDGDPVPPSEPTVRVRTGLRVPPAALQATAPAPHLDEPSEDPEPGAVSTLEAPTLPGDQLGSEAGEEASSSVIEAVAEATVDEEEDSPFDLDITVLDQTVPEGTVVPEDPERLALPELEAPAAAERPPSNPATVGSRTSTRRSSSSPRPMSSWSAAPLTGSLEDLRRPSVVPLGDDPGPPNDAASPSDRRSRRSTANAVSVRPVSAFRTPGPGARERWSIDVSAQDGPATVEEPAPASLQSQLEAQRAEGGVPARVGRYHIRSALAQVRGMWVLTGWDPNLSRPVRIHLLDPRRGWDPHLTSEQRVSRFKVAGRRWSGLRHSTLPSLLDGGRDGSLYFLVFESPTGTLLTELLADPGGLSMARIRGVLTDVTEGLLYLHTNGLVLGHVRAASICVGQEGARFVDMAHLGESGEVGAPPRPLLAQAPESVAGAPYDHRSEQFALGALLYQLLVGQRPFEGVDDKALSIAIRHRGIRSPKDHNPNVDGTLSHCCMRMLSPSPEGRYPSLREVLGALKAPRIPAQDTEPDAPVSAEPASRSRSVVVIEPALPSETTESILRKGGISAAAFRTWAEAERHLDGLHPSLLVISSASGTVTPPERSTAEWRMVPPAASRLLGPPLATDGLVERLAALAGRALGVGPAPAGPPEGWPSRLARQVCLRLGLGHDTAMRVAVAMAFRQMQHRLRVSANDISDLVPVEARRLFRFRPQPGLPGPPAAQTLWAVEMFFAEMMPVAGASRRPARVLQSLRSHVGTELDTGVMEALVAQLRELYPELDLPVAGQVVPRLLLAGLTNRLELADALEREGFAVDTAHDGHEVWSLMRAKPYRTVVVVADLPGRDGLSLLKLTRNHPETRSVAMLLLIDDAPASLQEAVDAAPPAELMALDSPLEALRVRIVRLMRDGPS